MAHSSPSDRQVSATNWTVVRYRRQTWIRFHARVTEILGDIRLLYLFVRRFLLLFESMRRTRCSDIHLFTTCMTRVDRQQRQSTGDTATCWGTDLSWWCYATGINYYSIGIELIINPSDLLFNRQELLLYPNKLLCNRNKLLFNRNRNNIKPEWIIIQSARIIIVSE